MKKTDYFKLLDKWNEACKLPDGKKFSRRNASKYMIDNYSGKFISEFTKKPVGLGGFSQWFNDWYAIKTIPKKDDNYIDPSINILDDDFEFEEGENETLDPYVLPNADRKILLLCDIHIPYHDYSALKVAINYGRSQQVNAIIINGDAMDMYQISKFEKIPSKKTLRDEIELCKQFLKQLRKLFPTEKIIYKVGNHENRLARYIITRAPELFGLDVINLKELLQLKELNIDFIESSQPIKAGDLLICHGHEWGGGGGVFAARSILLKANCSVIVGHFHRSQECLISTAKGDTVGCWAVGCLCNLRPGYMPFNQWNSGFAIIETYKNGRFSVRNKKIINGEVY
jgi:predicted phosphodiesterase